MKRGILICIFQICLFTSLGHTQTFDLEMSQPRDLVKNTDSSLEIYRIQKGSPNVPLVIESQNILDAPKFNVLSRNLLSFQNNYDSNSRFISNGMRGEIPTYIVDHLMENSDFIGPSIQIPFGPNK